MRRIRVFGELGQRFGGQFHLEVGSAAEAIRALACQIPGFEKFIIESEQAGCGYVAKVNDCELTDIKEFYIGGTGEISIVPVIAGSNGEGRILIGAALIVASFASVAVGAPPNPYFLNAGIAMALGGAAEVLTRGFLSSGAPAEKADNKPSYAFSGPVNTSAQGQPVPICYGIMRVGGAVISASIQTENLQAGYQYEDQEDSKICYAFYRDDFFFPGELPTNISRKVLLEYIPAGPGNEFGPGVERWKYQVFFIKKVLVLRPL